MAGCKARLNLFPGKERQEIGLDISFIDKMLLGIDYSPQNLLLTYAARSNKVSISKVVISILPPPIFASVKTPKLLTSLDLL